MPYIYAIRPFQPSIQLNMIMNNERWFTPVQIVQKSMNPFYKKHNIPLCFIKGGKAVSWENEF